MDDASVVEEDDKQCFDLGFLQMTLFCSQGSRWTQRHRLSFWFRIELVAPGLISRDDVFQKQWILVTHGNEVSRSFHPFCFLFVCELVRHVFRLTKSLRTIACAVSLLMPNSFVINLKRPLDGQYFCTIFEVEQWYWTFVGMIERLCNVIDGIKTFWNKLCKLKILYCLWVVLHNIPYHQFFCFVFHSLSFNRLWVQNVKKEHLLLNV